MGVLLPELPDERSTHHAVSDVLDHVVPKLVDCHRVRSRWKRPVFRDHRDERALLVGENNVLTVDDVGRNAPRLVTVDSAVRHHLFAGFPYLAGVVPQCTSHLAGR